MVHVPPPLTPDKDDRKRDRKERISTRGNRTPSFLEAKLTERQEIKRQYFATLISGAGVIPRVLWRKRRTGRLLQQCHLLKRRPCGYSDARRSPAASAASSPRERCDTSPRGNVRGQCSIPRRLHRTRFNARHHVTFSTHRNTANRLAKQCYDWRTSWRRCGPSSGTLRPETTEQSPNPDRSHSRTVVRKIFTRKKLTIAAFYLGETPLKIDPGRIIFIRGVREFAARILGRCDECNFWEILYGINV